MDKIEKVSLAFLPTPIYKLETISKQYGKEIYVKRDDLTGIEMSGNKVRKLEYSLKEAIDQGCDMLITCGGMQSNHARATAFVASKLNMKCCLLLRGTNDERVTGNYFLDKLVGANIIIKSPEEFNSHKIEIMESIKKEYEDKGYHPYIIPMGASNGIGTFGYIDCFKEIIKQEQDLNIEFDTIINAVGSGGTYTGLYIGNEIYQANKNIVGFNVCDDEMFFVNEIKKIVEEVESYLLDKTINTDNIHIIDGYVGKGYALSTKEELQFISDIAKKEAMILDPVYTGKAFYGFCKELETGTFNNDKNILFIHTGGLYGLFPKENEFVL